MRTEGSQRRGSRKLAAVLAGGLVLGVSTVAALASMNNSEAASAILPAGLVIFEGAADQATFSDHATAGSAAALAFSVPFNNLTPNEVGYAGYAVRLGAGTTNNATVTVTNTATGAAADYHYTLFTTATAGCSAAAVSTGRIVAASDLGAGTGTFALTRNASASVAGAKTFLCFKVTAKPTVAQGSTSTITWRLQAVSY